jgi:hypothetical protein
MFSPTQFKLDASLQLCPLPTSFIYAHSRREFMFIGQQHKHFYKIPKGLYVKIVAFYIQSLRDSGNCLLFCSINMNSLRE